MRPRRRADVLPAASALLLALAQPPFDLPVLAFTGLVPFALFVHGQGPGAPGRRAALRGALVFGALHFGLTLYWIPVALARFSWLAVPGYLAVVLVLTAVMAAMGWLLWAAVHRVRLPLWAALPVAWTAGEWVRAHLPGGLAFPWLELGISLSAFPELAGAAEIVGTRGLSFWMALVNGLLAGAVLAFRGGEGRRWARPVLAALVVTALPMAWGVWRAGTLEVRPAAPVAVVQPGVGAELRLDARAGWDATRAALDRLLPELAPGAASLVALPEVTFRGDPGSARGRAAAGSLLRHARRLGTPLLFGALEREGTEGRTGLRNSAFLMTEDGLAPFRYDKRRLVPGVERAPLGVARILPAGGDFEVGRGAPLLDAGGARHGVLICYESSYPELARDYRRAGADVLLNLTNDAWFGGEPAWARTTALRQHPAHLVLRAIENRMGVARAAATGVSLFVDPVGRVHEATPLFEPALRVRDPGTTDIRTLYTRLGDLVGNASAALAVLLALLAGWRARAESGGRVDPPSGGPSLDPSAPGH